MQYPKTKSNAITFLTKCLSVIPTNILTNYNKNIALLEERISENLDPIPSNTLKDNIFNTKELIGLFANDIVKNNV